MIPLISSLAVSLLRSARGGIGELAGMQRVVFG